MTAPVSSGPGATLGLQRAIQLEAPGRLSLTRRRIEEPKADQVRVRVSHAGICGSDLHVYQTGAYVLRFPVTPGHEVSGFVDAVGPTVHDLAPGTAVVLDSRVPCGMCEWCAAGEKQRCLGLGFLGEVCHGGFAETVVVPRDAAFPIPPQLPLHVAALAEPCAVALHGVRRALAISPGIRSALVIGLGPLGTLVSLVLGRNGIRVTGLEANEQRRRRVSRAIGLATLAANMTPGEDLDLVVDAAGFAGSIDTCLRWARRGGTVLMLALHEQAESLPANDVVERELILLGGHVFRDEIEDALGLLAESPETFAPIVTAEVPLAGVKEAYETLLRRNSDELKIMVVPGNDDAQA